MRTKITANYNGSYLTVQNSATYASNILNTALERMSTGFRVNCAADDVAGMYVASGLERQIRGLLQARNNTSNALSLLSTGMKSLNTMNGYLNRLRELAVQASNGFYDSSSRDAIQQEADSLVSQLYQTKNSTVFNCKTIFGDVQNVVNTSVSALSGGGLLTR